MTKYVMSQKNRELLIKPVPEGKLKQTLKYNLSYVKQRYDRATNTHKPYPVNLYKADFGMASIGFMKRVEKIIKDFSKENEIEHLNFIPEYDVFKRDNHGYRQLRPYQKNAVKQFMKFMKYGGGILQLPTGSGKTMIALTIIEMLKVKTLVVVPTTYLKNQWEGLIKPKWDVKVVTYQSIKSKSFLQQFKFVVFDECHHVAAKTLQLIGHNVHPETISLGLSATPTMRDGDNLKIISVIGEVCYKITTKDLIDDGYLSKAKILYYPSSVLRERNHVHVEKEMSYPEIYDKWIVNNEKRNRKIVEQSIMHAKPCLILVSHVKHGHVLNEMYNDIRDTYLAKQPNKISFTHSKNKISFGDSTILIASPVLDEGVDIPALRTLILAGGGKSQIKVIQRMGRVLRKDGNHGSVTIIDFIDKVKPLYKHSLERKRIIRKELGLVP